MYIVIFITASGKKEAEDIARALLKNKLAACVNIVERVKSFFWWKGSVDQAKESLLIIKSKKAKFPRIIKLVKSIHSYKVPEIIALPVVCGESNYLRWVDESIK